jgi:4-diphosphocytidyl-2-C-methyl-D-erythritol kinase
VEIHIQKRIPMAGGLAGGSTDAAAVLRALNRLLPKPLSMEQLCEIGGRLGADVPFCTVGGAMRTQGIGDVLTPVPSMPTCSLVIARRGEGVSTPWAYGRLDEIYADFADRSVCPASGLDTLLGALERGSLEGVCASVYNIFEDVVAAEKQDVTSLREEMLRHGALTARMSGSGPSVFGIFATEQAASEARDALLNLGADAFVCTPFAQNFS